MNRLLTPLYPLTLALGSAGLAAAAFNAARHHPVALAMALLIAAGFALGVAELRAFRRATQGLSRALAALTQPATPAWLQTVPVALRTAVEQRLAGQRVALPGLALAPALTGVLVLLGMLGTFIGLVLTLGGTADAVSNTADLSALRAALGAPVRGLGLAFSASVAGVTASATLGLLLALARRERAEASRTLDLAQLGSLRPLTAEFQREQAQAAAEQAAREATAAQQRALVEQFQAFSQQLATTVTEQLAGQQARWEGRQHEAQQRFHTDALSAYQGLASSVDTTLRASLHEAMNASQQHASDTLQPLAEGLLSRIGDATQALQSQLGQQLGNWAAQQSETLQASSHRLAAEQAAQASALRSQFEQGAKALLDHTRQAQATLLAETREAEAALLQQTRQAEAAQQANSATQIRALLQALHDQQHSLQQAHAEADRERLAAWAQAQQAAAEAQQAHLQALVAQVEAQTQGLMREAAALLQAAGEAPRAALDTIAALREQLAQSQAQDQAALQERAALMQTLSTLLASLQHAAAEQRAAIDGLVQSAGQQLGDASRQFGEHAAQAGANMARAAEQIALSLSSSAGEVGALSEGLAAAVEQARSSQSELVAQLTALQDALAQAMTRSDDQMAYTVAQAREVIDLCLGAQQQALAALQQAGGSRG